MENHSHCVDSAELWNHTWIWHLAKWDQIWNHIYHIWLWFQGPISDRDGVCILHIHAHPALRAEAHGVQPMLETRRSSPRSTAGGAPLMGLRSGVEVSPVKILAMKKHVQETSTYTSYVYMYIYIYTHIHVIYIYIFNICIHMLYIYIYI